MAHKVHIYDFGRPLENGMLRPERSFETEDPEAAIAFATRELERIGSAHAVRILPDWRLCPDLASWFRLSNHVARWTAENPSGGGWVSHLVEDPEHWAGYGVRTPEELEKFLLLNDYSDLYKDVNGIRPRTSGLDMSSSIEEIEAQIRSLRDQVRYDDDRLEP